jgi:uncharacterized membrane protein YeiB
MAPRTGRLAGLDAARAVALAGMLAVHLVVPTGGGVVRWVWELGDGRAMPLFVLLAGAGFELLTRRAPHPVREVLGRAAVLAVIGLVMVDHVPLIAVIVHCYAAFYLAGLALRRLPDTGLLVVAAAVTVVGGWTFTVLAPHLPMYEGWSGWATVTDPWPLAADLTVTGYYPLLPSLAFFAVGMWVARRDLRDRAQLIRLAMAGAALAGVGYGVGGLVWADGTEAHGNLPPWVLGSLGTGLFVVAVCGLGALAAPRPIAPLAAAGRLALTAYVLQGLALRWWWVPGEGMSRRGEWLDLALVVAAVVGFAAFAAAWSRRRAPGPAEALVRLGGRAASRGPAALSGAPGAPARRPSG